MRNWRALKAAREGRELRRERDRSRLLRADAMAWRRQAELALRAPLNRLKADAFKELAWRSAQAIAKIEDEHTRRVMEHAQSDVRERLDVNASEVPDALSSATVFHFRLPAIDYRFMADLRRMAE